MIRGVLPKNKGIFPLHTIELERVGRPWMDPAMYITLS